MKHLKLTLFLVVLCSCIFHCNSVFANAVLAKLQPLSSLNQQTFNINQLTQLNESSYLIAAEQGLYKYSGQQLSPILEKELANISGQPITHVERLTDTVFIATNQALLAYHLPSKQLKSIIKQPISQLTTAGNTLYFISQGALYQYNNKVLKPFFKDATKISQFQ